MTEQIKGKEARRDILNRPLPVSCGSPPAAKSKVWTPEEPGWCLDVCVWSPLEVVNTGAAEAEEYNQPSFAVPPSTSPHIPISRKERGKHT